MKLLLKRAKVVLILLLILVFGFIFYTVNFMNNASIWVQYPTNSHLYKNGQLMSSGTIYDRRGVFLAQTVEGTKIFNKNKSVRTAVMHATGDAKGNVVTGAQVAFGDRLTGWNLLNGVYRFNKESSTSSNDITLTLDADLCAAAFNAIKGMKGTVGVYNYKTGEILCMVSSPSFDPKNPPAVEKNPIKYEGAYINRFLSATYTPGSVFKLVTASAAVDNFENIDTKVYHCDGRLVINGQEVTCPSVHGDVTLEQALAKSCNVAFAHITLEIGAETLQEYAEKAGFSSRLKVDGITTAIGEVNVANTEDGDLAWAGIGQYSDMANPLNFMTYVGAIANGGVRIPPKIVSHKGIYSIFSTFLSGKKRILSLDTAETLKKMMRNNVINSYGERNYSGLKMCAKSGTAEVAADKKPHAWFVGFLDREDCPFAFVVVIENGGSGSKVAGPIAAKVLQATVSSMAKK